MGDRTEFSHAKRRLQLGDVFHRANYDLKTQSRNRWKDGCPWHESSSGTCFPFKPKPLSIIVSTANVAEVQVRIEKRRQCVERERKERERWQRKLL